MEPDQGLTPPPLAAATTTRALELEAVLELLSSWASTDVGAARIRSRRPTSEASTLAQRRSEYLEVARVLEAGGALVSHEEEPVASWMPALRSVVQPLECQSLLQIARVLETVVRAGEAFGEAPDAYPTWSARLRPLLHPTASAEPTDGPAGLADAIRAVLDNRGEVRADASPALLRLTAQARATRRRLSGRFEKYVELHRDRLGEETVSLRDGRYSVLLPSGHRGRLAGLVQGRSGTGRSYYFEPLELVEPNNQMQGASAAVDEERARLLSELELQVKSRASLVEASVSVLADLDLQQAAARFAESADARLPELSHRLRVVSGRHPLLDPRLAQRREQALGSPGNEGEVVPLEVAFDQDRVLVITGPNAGGKTVALKTVGLFALMTHCGLPLTAGAGTSFPPLARVVASVGDAQDLLNEKSTFSAQLIRLEEAWRSAKPGALILLDEVGSGTNPEEGSALGVALLEGLVESGSHAILTTHLVEIASAALSLPFARCMAMEFDGENHRPTFSLRSGPPGASEALALARRLGLPSAWLDRAEARLGSDHRDLRALIAEAEAQRKSLALERGELETLRSEQQRILSRLEEEREEAKAERRSLRNQLEKDLLAFRSDVKGKLGDEVTRMKRELEGGRRRELDTRAAQRLFREAPRIDAPPDETPAGGVLELGAQVRHRALGWQGRLERLDENSALVNVSGKKIRCRCDELSPLSAAGEARPIRSSRRKEPIKTSEVSVDAELNLIGLRVAPALDRLDEYLDRALLSSHATVRVIHGHGTGRLRQAVREHLHHHLAVAGHSPGSPSDGGNGATVVTLRES